MRQARAFVMLLMLLPCRAGMSPEDGHEALTAYLRALQDNDVSRLESLLGPHFEYRYYEGDSLQTLDRDAELRGLRKLFDEATFEVKAIRPDQSGTGESRVTFNVYFKDSSADLRSFFFDTGLALDDTLVVTLEKGKIARMVAVRHGRTMTHLSFGRLKSLYSRDTVLEYQERGPDGIFKLFDGRSHEPLLWKQVRDHKTDMETTFYLPNDIRVTNVLY